MDRFDEKAREIVGECTCSEQYRHIRESGINPARTDPNCRACEFDEEFAQALRDTYEEGLMDAETAVLSVLPQVAENRDGGDYMGYGAVANKRARQEICALKGKSEKNPTPPKQRRE